MVYTIWLFNIAMEKITMLFIGKPFSMAMLNNQRVHVYASGWKTARVHVLRFEYVGWVGWDINVHVPCVHTWMLRCCYVTGQGLGGVGWDINVHVPCVHTWMLRCCYVTGQGLGGVGWDIKVHVPCVHTWMLRCCYVTAATSLVAKASWWQTVPHATLNWPLNTICFMKLAIIVRASSASPRKSTGETC